MYASSWVVWICEKNALFIFEAMNWNLFFDFESILKLIFLSLSLTISLFLSLPLDFLSSATFTVGPRELRVAFDATSSQLSSSSSSSPSSPIMASLNLLYARLARQC